MHFSFGKTGMVLGLLPLGATLRGAPDRMVLSLPPTAMQALVQPHASRQMLMIRVSQESSPGTGDFDTHILGFVRALQTVGDAADFYMYGKSGPDYGNSEPILYSNTSHIFFVNAADGLSLFVVHNNANHAENGHGGAANTRWELSGGTAAVLKEDDTGETTTTDGGTVFTDSMNWAQSYTDGMVVGALPTGFTILGQFLDPPKNLGGGWEVISADGSRIQLSLVPGQRVRLDVNLAVNVRQDH